MRVLATCAALVPVQPVSAGVEGELEMALGGVERSGGSRRIEHSQQSEAEARRVDVAQFDVAAVTVGRIGVPSLRLLSAPSACRCTADHRAYR